MRDETHSTETDGEQLSNRSKTLSRRGTLTFLGLSGLGMISGVAAASTPIKDDMVPYVITESGDYEVVEDINFRGDRDEAAIRIEADEVTLNGNEHEISARPDRTMPMAIGVVGVSDVRIHDVRTRHGSPGIRFENASGCILENTEVRRKKRHGVEFEGVTGSILQNITSHTSERGSGFWLVDSDDNVVRNNISRHDDNGGISLTNSNNNTVTNNRFSHSNDGWGIIIRDSKNNIVTNNECLSHDFTGISVGGSKNVVERNDVNSNDDGGIDVSGSNNTVRHNDITGTESDYGMRVRGTEHRVMHNNLENPDSDIEMQITGADSQITRNTINRGESSGIHLTGESSSNRVIRSEVRSDEDDEGFDIKDEGDRNQVRANITG